MASTRPMEGRRGAAGARAARGRPREPGPGGVHVRQDRILLGGGGVAGRADGAGRSGPLAGPLLRGSRLPHPVQSEGLRQHRGAQSAQPEHLAGLMAGVLRANTAGLRAAGSPASAAPDAAPPGTAQVQPCAPDAVSAGASAPLPAPLYPPPTPTPTPNAPSPHAAAS